MASWLDDLLRLTDPEANTVPSVSQQGYWPHVDDNSEDLAYLPDAAYAERVAERLTKHTVSVDGSSAAASGGTHAVSFATIAGYRYELVVRVMAEDGAGDLEFDEEQIVVATNVGGTASLKNATIAYSNFAADWSMAISVSTSNVTATVTNDTANTRGVSIAFELSRLAAIPAAP